MAAVWNTKDNWRFHGKSTAKTISSPCPIIREICIIEETNVCLRVQRDFEAVARIQIFFSM